MTNFTDFANSYIKQGLYITQVYINTNSEGYKTVNFPKNWLNNLRKTTVQNWSGNIAIATGHGNDCNVCVLDVDSPSHRKDGVNGLESIEKWQKEHGAFPDTRIAETPTGGRHYYFKVPQDIHIKRGSNLLPGVDVQGDKACVIAPPSVYNSKRYKWINHTKIAEANDSVLELMRLKQKGRDEEVSSLPQNYKSDDLDFSEGNRHTAFNTLIGRLKKDGGLSDRDIEDTVRIKNSLIDAPLSDEELEKTVLGAIPRFDRKFKTKDETPKEVSLIELKTVDPKPVEWLIPNWIPAKKLTLIGAEGGTGKTNIWCSILGSLSRGEPCFFEDPATFEKRKPMRSIILSSEDEFAEIIVPRLKKVNADLSMISGMEFTNPLFDEIKINSQTFEKMIHDYKPALVILDPYQSFMPFDANLNAQNQVRACLNPLMRIGMETGTTFIFTMHTNKDRDAYGRGRLSGSTDTYDFSRSVFLIGKSKNGQLYLDHAKSNYGPTQKTVLFDLPDGVPTFVGTTEKKDWDFVHERKLERSAPARDEAKKLIVDNLEQLGEISVKKLNAILAESDVSTMTARRARKDLEDRGIVTTCKKGNGKGNGVTSTVKLVEEPLL
ncbi:AAA family ATPase [Faecalicoccus pleomorphus]|uniref:AAA family ATPase n=1 Tax=Faecalicoccus pleomorphus TaxID=1323 RepID=UPI00195F8AB5|nr:AAA family ATPase [Faecalicoccus pleomorphus]MBM6808570.1 AAA family ATPase [Faecalicoccus pleomorphus]